MRRRTLILLVMSLLVVGMLAACGGKEEPTATPAPTEAPTEAPEPTAAPAEAEAPAAGEEAATEEESATEEAAETEEEATQEAEAAPEEEVAEETEAGAEETSEEPPSGESQVTVESVRAIPDLLNEKDAAFTAISPDGAQMVYAKTEGRFWNTTGNICVHTFANADKTCYEVPKDQYYGYMYSFVWSPDSTKVAFTENPIQLGYESDIWVFDAADGSMTNLTDDGVVGSWAAAEPDSYVLDYLPMWDESTGDLYFWRSVPSGNLSISFELMKIPADGGEAEFVQDVSDALDGMVMTWDIEDYFLDGPSSLAPDGSKVAMVLQAFQDPYNDSRTGVWVLDVGTGELTQVAAYEDLLRAVPTWQEAPANGVATQWTGDSEGFVVLVISWTSNLRLAVFYYFDAASGDMTPVVDFSGVPSYEALMTAPEDGISPRYYSPWTATVSPAGDKLFMLSDLAGVAGLLTIPLPPADVLPAVAGAAESYSSMGGARSSVAEDGKVVIYGFLLTTVEE